MLGNNYINIFGNANQRGLLLILNIFLIMEVLILIFTMLFSNSSLDFGVASDSLSKSERSEQTVNRLRVENSVSNAREGDVRISAR